MWLFYASSESSSTDSTKLSLGDTPFQTMVTHSDFSSSGLLSVWPLHSFLGSEIKFQLLKLLATLPADTLEPTVF